jgi:hypothetical protein
MASNIYGLVHVALIKSNNTELQEALKPRYEWYQNAAECYVCLADVLVQIQNSAERFIYFRGKALWGSKSLPNTTRFRSLL